jgi:haloacetate dehalogenase
LVAGLTAGKVSKIEGAAQFYIIGRVPVFDGFEEFDIETSSARIHGRRGGTGPPALFLHGIPETHVMWHRVVPRLAEHYTVVATDLRGYGDSSKPPSTEDHEPYSMRATAGDQVEVMQNLGYNQFRLVGHDRGARCAYRLALDAPGAVTRLVVMDVVPTGDAYSRADMKFSLGYWVWSFLAAPEPVPEQFIAAAPAVLVNFMLDSWPEVKDAFPAEVRAEYVRKFSDPDTVHAICEEYRAAATLDYEQDEKDRGKRKIACPVLFLWSQRGSVAQLYDDPLAIWRGWADDVDGGPIPVGHFIPEEAPEETTRRLLDFLK